MRNINLCIRHIEEGGDGFAFLPATGCDRYCQPRDSSS